MAADMPIRPTNTVQLLADTRVTLHPQEQEIWEIFISFLTKLTSVMGEVNNDQYLTLLDICARLTTAGGETPYIGSNGNWWVGSSDTGVSAIPPYVGPNGNWFVGGIDTGVSAGQQPSIPPSVGQPYGWDSNTQQWVLIAPLIDPVDGGSW